MDTYVLIIFLAYAGNMDTGGGVAITSLTRDYYLEADCTAAKRLQLAEFERAGFKRFSVICTKRTSPLLEPLKEGKK